MLYSIIIVTNTIEWCKDMPFILLYITQAKCYMHEEYHAHFINIHIVIDSLGYYNVYLSKCRAYNSS